MRILVTGGAGFIGGHLAERFINDGHDVVVLDNLDEFYPEAIKRQTIRVCEAAAEHGGGTYEFVNGDIRDAETIQSLVGDVEYVYHQAAKAGVRPSVEDPRTYVEVNVDGTLNVLDACREEGIERVVVASSSSVYGRPRYLPYDEEHPTTPISPYGASKLAAEQHAMAYGNVYDIPVTALRYFTVYGPRMRPNMAISNFVSRCMNGNPPVVYGDGSQTRDFTYIEDIVDMNAALLTTSKADGEVFNVGSTDQISIRTLAAEVRDQLAPEVELVYDTRHKADAEHTHADVSKASELLDYRPEYTIREGVQSFIDWYSNNQNWYDPLVTTA